MLSNPQQDPAIMILYGRFVWESDHIETLNFRLSGVILLQGIRSSSGFRTLRGIVLLALGRLGLCLVLWPS